MLDVVVVRLNSSNFVYYLSPNLLELKKNDLVVIDTDNGLQIGTVVKANYKEKEENLDLSLQKVERVATDKDIADYEANMKVNEEALTDAK